MGASLGWGDGGLEGDMGLEPDGPLSPRPGNQLSQKNSTRSCELGANLKVVLILLR